jgi:hypothetical protein
VSTGSREPILESGLSSTVAIDQNFTVGSLYGSNGTPSAILVNKEGKIASVLVTGEVGVMKLLANRQEDVLKSQPRLVGAGVTA